MGSDSSESTPAVAEPSWLKRLHPRSAGACCWKTFRLDQETHGRILNLVSYIPAMILTILGVVVAAILYGFGYMVTHPDAMMGSD